jgi:pyrroline-5-carboxylate reductase
MVLETGLHPAELKDQVCSPAGTTIEAVYALEKNGFRHLIMEAMSECTRRALEIGRAS